MRSNRAELAVLRGKRTSEGLEMWVQAFGKGDRRRAERYALAVSTLLGDSKEGEEHFGHLSANTRKAYLYAITEFFEWVASKYRRVVAPEDITRKDAEDYVSWLANKPYSLAAEKLKDGDRKLELEVYKIVDSLGSAKLRDIEERVGPSLRSKYHLDAEKGKTDRAAFSKFVRSLVTLDVLESKPTLCDLRASYPQIGITQWEIRKGKNRIKLEDVFTYSVFQPKESSQTTIAQRVSALSSLWDSFSEGDNKDEPLLKHNIWKRLQKRVSRGISSHKKEASREQKMTDESVIHILKNLREGTLVQTRNKAIFYLMVFAGLRTTELLQIRRANPDSKKWKHWFDGSEPPALHLLRKGNKVMRIPYPPAALRALIQFQTKLDSVAAPSYAQSTNANAPHYIPPTSRAWHYQKLQLPDAPLFPPLYFWGNNSLPNYRKSLTRHALYSTLRGLGRETGLAEEVCNQIHPHAIRHFSANAMLMGGKDIREIQAILGHTSVTTTETYLQDVDEEVRLSGQDAILSFLQKQGAFEGPPEAPKPKASSVVDTIAFEVEGAEEEEPLVSKEEVEVIQKLQETIPENELPISPPEYDPPVTAMATESGVVIETEGQIQGIDTIPSKEDALEDLQSTIKGGKSPGSPDWVYEAMSDPEARHETVIFNRGGERDIDWLEANYPQMPKNFGVGHESFLPWFVKARGNVTRGGFFKGVPPLPVLSPEQVNPETSTGMRFLKNVEEKYSKFVHGDPEAGELPSPLRSIGIVRWYSFFAYHTNKMEEDFNQYFQEAVPAWHPYNAVVPLGDFRAHNEEWVLQWLVDNAHTYRTSVDSMKRGVKRSEGDYTNSFLKATFEGIDLVTDMPDWIVENDPVRALYDSDRAEWKQMITWLKNVTGQALEPDRKVDRADQLEFAEEEQKLRARTVRDILMSVSKSVDLLSRAKHLTRERVTEYRAQLRQDLVLYALVASGEKHLAYTMEGLQEMSTKDFNEAMAEEYDRLDIPNPNTKKYRGKEKISRIVTKLFPELPVLEDGNIFAGSKLFSPAWFRIDKENKTITIDKDERDELLEQFGQDPELLVRRAARAMWEARTQDYEALWGIMMSYFSWIIPSGQEMESQVTGIPVADLGDEDLNREARQNWLKYFLSKVKGIATGKEPEEPEWKKALREMEESEGKEDAMDRVASDALDFLSVSSIDDYAMDPETMMMMAEESGSFYPNRKRRMMPNKKGTYVVLEGEQPKGWYKVDLFGTSEKRYRPNAPPRFMSPGAVYLTQKLTFVARQLLPSPFRMVSAIELPE